MAKAPAPKAKLSSFELHIRAEELGVSPFDILLLFANGDAEALNMPIDEDTGLPQPILPKHRLSAATEACKYLYPQLKSVEVSGNPEKPIEQKLSLINDILGAMEQAVRNGKNDPTPEEIAALKAKTIGGEDAAPD